MKKTESKGFKIKTKGGENKMIRKLIVGAIVLNFAFILSGVITSTFNMLPSSFAANTTIDGPASAHVDGILELQSGGIRKIPANTTGVVNPWLFPNSTTFDFGSLVFDSTQGYYTGQFYYTTLMIPVSSGRPYKITEFGTALTGANSTIQSNGFLQIPDYNEADQLGGVAQGSIGDARCSPPSSAVGTHDVYVAGLTGAVRIVRGIIAISGPPVGETKPTNYDKGHDATGAGVGTKQQFAGWLPVDQNTRAGDYSSSVTYTLSLI